MVREPPTEQDKILFKLRIKDLESIGIKVATIDEHSQLEVLLKQLIARCRPCRLFIAGSPTEKKPDVGDRYPSIDLPKSMSDFANELGAAFAETSVALSAGASFGAQVGYALLKRLRLAWPYKRCIFVRRSKSMTGTTTATGDGLRSHLDTVWSADQVAHLLAFAEQANHRDGWLTADDLGQLSHDTPCEDHGKKWRTAIARLGEQFTNFRILLARSPGYPSLLLETAHAPAVLFVRGSLDSSGEGSVAMVGSRDASEQAADAAREVAATLADTGTTIVSGLARGVDTAAHRGALDARSQSAAFALRESGAIVPAIVVVARRINPDWRPEVAEWWNRQLAIPFSWST